MIVPSYWAEARLQQKTPERQVTVRRFGWSDVSQEIARRHAETRAQEALARILSGDKNLPRREPKVPYHGGDGLPIREEILERRGEMVVTRNSYGARCLNVPDVLIADIDLPHARADGSGFVLGILLVAGVAIFRSHPGWSNVLVPVLGAIIALIAVRRFNVSQVRSSHEQREEKRVPAKLRAFVEKQPEWHLRLYRTPLGFRVIALQQTFAATDPAVLAAFTEWGVDRVYTLMCQNQQCFRARLTAKPWRIGITQHLRPSPGVWPINPERMPERQDWVRMYESKARDFAACRFMEAMGSGVVCPEAATVCAAHDEWCGAETEKPLA